MNNALTLQPKLPAALTASGPDVLSIVLQFLAAEIRNANTRRSYTLAIEAFFDHASTRPGGNQIETLTPLHIAGWVENMQMVGLSIPTVKQRLAALKRVFQYLTANGVLRINPAASVRGPKYSAKRGKTPVLTAEETRQLLDSIDCSTLIGLRDRAIIATMVYTFARIGAVSRLLVEDVFVQKRRLWLRLEEKGGKCTEVPCHHNLEAYLTAYMEAADLHQHPKAFVFQTMLREDGVMGRAGRLSGRPMIQQLAYSMLQRRAREAGLDTNICNHTFRATGITTYLQNGGTLERAAHIANHTSTRTTQLYDRRPDDITLDEIEKIQI